MSYSNASRAATAYRQREVLAASPARMVVMVYDHTLSNLMRAAAAADPAKLEIRLEALTRARAGIMELFTTVDTDKGGELGNNLRGLYGFVFTQLMDEARNPNPTRLKRLTAIVADLRDAFATIATDGAARVSAA